MDNVHFHVYLLYMNSIISLLHVQVIPSFTTPHVKKHAPSLETFCACSSLRADSQSINPQHTVPIVETGCCPFAGLASRKTCCGILRSGTVISTLVSVMYRVSRTPEYDHVGEIKRLTIRRTCTCTHHRHHHKVVSWPEQEQILRHLQHLLLPLIHRQLQGLSMLGEAERGGRGR